MVYETYYEVDYVPVTEQDEALPVQIGEEGSISDYLENIENSTEIEAVTLEQADSVEYLSQIAGDVRIILALVLVTFCWNAMRSFRKHTLKGGN